MERLRTLLAWTGRHKLLVALVAAALIALGALARVYRERGAGILTEPLRRGPIVQAVYGIGTVTAARSWQIKVGVVSRVTELHVDEGGRVRRGQPLLRLDATLYVAPFAGTVTFLPYKQGENVFAQQPILSLVDLTDRYLVVSMEQQGALRVRPGQPVKMSFDAIRQTSYDGQVESVYSNAGQFLARVNVSTLPAQVLPGMTADVAIEVDRADDALLVPSAALDRGHLWVKRGRAVPRRVEVKVGIVDKDQAQVTEGDVRAGDRVLIKKELR